MRKSDTDPALGHTWAIELTPPGRAAVAVVLVAGPHAVRIVEQCFRPVSGRRLADVPLHRIVLGRWDQPDGEELVVCRRSAEQIEIHCHGGTAAVDAVMRRLIERGCRQISWQEWLRRTCGDSIRAAAHIALADAPTARTAAILLEQYYGALAHAVRAADAAIEKADWARAADAIDSVLAHRKVGMHLTTPWRVVLAGPTNVGKSSLINSLAGYQRSIVSHEPGTTRDVVTTTTAIDGWPVQLADTAGLRDPEDELESAGIELATATLANADLVVVVHDATKLNDNRQDDTVSTVLSSFAEPRRVIQVFNKIDLLCEKAGDEVIVRWQSQRHAARVVCTSAVTGEGIAHLLDVIGSALVPIAPAPGSAVPFTLEQVAALEAARAAVAVHDAVASHAALQPLVACSSVAG